MRDRSGSLDPIVSEASLLLRTRNELEAPDIEVVHLVVVLGEHRCPAEHGLALGVILMRPEIRGAVTLRGADLATSVDGVIDVETANPHRGSLCSVGMVAVENGQTLDRMSTLIRPPGLAPVHVWSTELRSEAGRKPSDQLRSLSRSIRCYGVITGNRLLPAASVCARL